jgi:hypothetical protein
MIGRFDGSRRFVKLQSFTERVVRAEGGGHMCRGVVYLSYHSAGVYCT